VARRGKRERDRVPPSAAGSSRETKIEIRIKSGSGDSDESGEMLNSFSIQKRDENETL
jgi:hypothetical protein